MKISHYLPEDLISKKSLILWCGGKVKRIRKKNRIIRKSSSTYLTIALCLSPVEQSIHGAEQRMWKITSKRFDYGKRNLASLAPLLTVNHHGLGPPNVCRENDSQVSRHFNLTLAQHFLASSKSPLTIGHNQAPDKVPKVHSKMTRLLPVER